MPFDVTQIGHGEAVAPARAVPTRAAVVAAPDEFSIRQWVVNDSDEMVRSAEFEAEAVEHCTEILFHIRKVAEETRNEAIVLEAEEVVKVLPCSA